MLQGWIGAGASNKFVSGITDRGDVWSLRASEPEPAGLAEGILPGTRIATPKGWRNAEALAPGDLVLTFDHGLQPVASVSRSTLWTSGRGAPRQVWPVHVPVNALGNRTELVLLPEQAVLIETDAAEMLYGDPFSLVPAASLEGYRGITRIMPDTQLEVVTLHFERDQIIYANGSSLLYSPAQPGSIASVADTTAEGYVRLSRSKVRELVACLKAEATPDLAYMPGAMPVASAHATMM